MSIDMRNKLVGSRTNSAFPGATSWDLTKLTIIVLTKAAPPARCSQTELIALQLVVFNPCLSSSLRKASLVGSGEIMKCLRRLGATNLWDRNEVEVGLELSSPGAHESI